MKRFYFLLISFLTLSIFVIAQVKMFVHQSNGNIVEILASRVDSISLLFPSKEEPDDPDVPVEPVFYTISFDANGGTGALSPEYLEDNESLIIPSNVFSCDGYIFICWNTKADGTGTIYTPGQSLTPTENITLYAQWEEVLKLETIVLSAEQIDDTNQVRVVAECSITPQRIVWFSKTENGTYREIQGENNNVLIITPEPSAYTYVKANMVTKSDEVVESLPIIISSTCLSVVFNDDFGTFERETDRASTPYVGPEYTYVGGCKPLKEEGTYAVMVNPKFAGSSDMNAESYACDIYGDLWYRDIYDHTQSGLENDRWGGLLLVNADAELVYSREVDVTPNTLMIYSAWVAYAANQNDDYGEILNSEITFVVRDARGRELVEMRLRLEDSDNGWQKGEVVFNTEENSIVTIELYNYNRGGVGNDFVIDDISFSICDEANVGIVAPVSISFNANGGLGNMNTEQINPLVYYTLPANTFSKENYFFTGWNTKADGTGESFTDVQSIYTKESLTLYAQWVKGVTVSFHANGGAGTMESKFINPTKSYKLPDNAFTKEDYFYNGWNTASDGTGIAYSDTQATYITEDLTLYAQWEEFLISSGTENGYEYVDLGLPSGIKWATVNVGAESPEDYGDYFAWGETESKSTYNWETYKWCEGSYDTMTKYCTSSSYGTVDDKTVLELADDAANANWHSDWRMPTNAEQDELRTECTWAWGTLNGVKGCKVTSKTNGNSIFLPAAGYRSNDYLYSQEVYGHYWSNTLYTRPYNAYNLCFNAGSNMFYSEDYRYEGHFIRPVIRVKETYTLTFNANNGEGIMSVIKAKEDEQISIPSNTFTRPAHKFIGWNTKADGTGVSYSADQTITLTENLTLYAQWKAFEMSGIENGYGYVDLGLPSGTKWAIMNIGAESPEEYGDYFAWGETQPKSSYTWSSYKHMTAGKSSWEYVNKYTYADGQTSGVWYSGSTFIGDNKKTLDSIDDVAQVSWGGNWRMPTKSGIDELRSNCTWTWTTQDGVCGYKVVSKTNGKSIFLPAAGYNEGSTVSSATTAGNYWSNTVWSSYSDYAYFLTFNSSSVTGSDKSRSRGNTVRAVIPALLNITLVANGGEGTMPNVKSEYGATVALPENTFTRQGYAFIGWNTKADGTGTAYTLDQSITVNGNITLYAQWQKLFIVSFNANDGSGIISSVELERNESFNIPSNVFTNSMNEFLGWNTKADGTGDVYTVGQSITLTEDLTLYAQWKLIVGIENGYQWVDLGLTSKTKWATMNVGATSEEGSGKYFAYGETQSKASYSFSNYTYSISSDVLPLSNDAAHVNWGGSWVIPTKEQQDELRAECIWTWTSRNGVDGYQVTSKVNGSSIFMPAVGYRRSSYSDSDGWMGYYWSSTATSSYGAYYMEFNNSGIGWNYDEEEYYGMSVRPVVPSIRIKFDANGGEGTMPYNYLETAGSYTIPNNSFIREYYLFVGWNTEADGTGIAYKEGEITTISSDVTLYAQWEKNRKLYFVNTIGWSSVGVYIWIDGTTTSYLEWPGESATKESITVNGHSIYSYNMVGKDQYDMIIFNNGTSQTSDLRIDYTKPYYYNGEWYSSLEDIVDKSEQYGYHSGYEWVDLGLTSGTLWARMNVGADSPEDYGDYFAWGEIETKEEYNWSTYKWCEGSYDTQNKYCTSSSYGTIDNKTTLDLADDAANANWGGNWRMPTKAEQDELRNECTWTWARNNGVKGYFVTGPNGNSIFLPAAGCREDSDLDNVGSYCSYWGSSLDSGCSSAAYYLYFYSDSIYCSSLYRSRGQSVRPVLSK